MDEHAAGRDWAWLKERLEQGGERPLPVVYSSFRPAGSESDPWTSTQGLAELERVRDHLLHGESEPSVLVVTDVEEDPSARVFTAVTLARSLAEASRSCVLVDADVRHVGLARHLPEEMSEAEGFIDVVQYGVSVPASLRATPVDGVRVLGVGSWRPDASEVFVDEDLRRLFAQLRSTGNIVLLLTPARMPDGRHHPLLVHGDAVVVSLDLENEVAPAVEELLSYLEGLGVPLGAVITYAGGESVDLAVDDALIERAARSGAQAPVGPGAATRDDAEAEVVTWNVQLDPKHAAVKDDLDRSSPVFRWIVGALVVILVGFVGWFVSTQRGDDDERSPVAGLGRPVTERAREATNPATTPEASEPFAILEPGSAADVATTRSIFSGSAPSNGTDAPEQASETITADAGSEIERAPARSSTSVTAQIDEPFEESPAPAATESPAAGAGIEDALQAALLRPVGAGYALHPWSFTDSLEAEASADGLRAEGMGPQVRSTVIDGRRWYRVLVGRYDKRADALRARELLATRSDVDYVGIVPVR